MLDRTAFYPEAGGQLGDRGTLGGVAVVDTQEHDDGTIVHLVDGEPPADRRARRAASSTGRAAASTWRSTPRSTCLSGALLDRAQRADRVGAARRDRR